MKKLHFFMIGALMLSFAAQGQRLRFSLLYEKTVAGNQYGSQFSFQTKQQWNLGVFYQAAWQRKTESQIIVSPFYGLSVSAPLVKCEKLNFYFNMRSGLVNKYFVIVTPGLETELKLSKTFCVSALMSMRMSYPSTMIKASIKF